jgi:penicillin-binding protein 1A
MGKHPIIEEKCGVKEVRKYTQKKRYKMEEKQTEPGKKKKPESRKQDSGKKSGVRIVLHSMLTIFRVMFGTLFLICIIAAIGAIGIVTAKLYPVYEGYKNQVAGVVEESTPDTFRLQEASYIYDVNGDVLAKLTGDEDSTYLPFEEIPQDAIEAFVAIEDRTFWQNSGIDLKGIIRVGINYFLTGGEEMHGASTITQQLARNRFLTREVSIERKIKEILIALDLTEKYTKEQIMEYYINDISFANTYYGLQAAARGYFGKNAGELTLSQIAYLCAIPNSPTYYNPYRHPENAIKRRDKILGDMMEMGFITEEEYETALAETITVERRSVPLHNYETTYAVDCAVRYLMRRDGFEFRYGFQNKKDYEEYEKKYAQVYSQERDALYTGGYNLYTSIDPERQAVLQASLDEVLSFDSKVSESGVYLLQGAATVIDNSTNRVVAIVGGRSQETDTYTLNRAFQSDRQPGSAIKPLIVYAPALENGYKSTTRIPNINVDEAKKKGADVKKLTGEGLALRNAVEKSRNGVAWYIYDDITPALGLSYLTQMRFDNIVPEDYYPATSLGGFTHGATTEEMAGAYAALAREGVYREPTCIVKMINNQGEDIFEEYPEIQVYQRNSAVLMTDILTGVIKRGTAASMGWSGEIEAAGKTGTTNGSKDGWFCGMTPYYTMSVWVGYDQPRMLSSLYGATYPASIWKNAMKGMTEGLPAASFAEPETDNGRGDGDYLAGHEDETEISAGYTVGDFRRDHQLADEAMELLEAAKTGSSGQSSSDLKKEAADRIAQIRSSSMRARMERIRTTGAPVNAAAAPPPTLPSVPVDQNQLPPAPETVPQGPGSAGTGPASQQPEAHGPASEIIN